MSAFRLCCVLLLMSGLWSVQAAAPLKAGDQLAELDTGRQVYRKVVIRSVNARTVSFSHEGGLAALPLHSLPAVLRERLGYDAAAEAAAEKALGQAKVEVQARLQREAARSRQQQLVELQQRYEKLMRSFVEQPELRQEQDLRQRFFELDLGVKSQGRRPSCAIFAVVSALEFLNAEVARKPEKLSEEYLIWATRRMVRREAPASEGTAPEEDDQVLRSDEGFGLGEVMTALNAFGIPLQESMPNTFGSNLRQIPDPAEAVVQEARVRRKVFVHDIPGHGPRTVLGNLVHILNAGIPIPVGLRWPHYRTVRQGLLSEQLPVRGYAHAVTLVGYRCATGRLEDTSFIFKNSYGTDWGQGGYGIVTYSYLSKHLLAGVLLEVQDR